MSKLDKIQSALRNCGASLASIVKISLMSRPVCKPRKGRQTRELVVLGNGPSLAQTLADERGWLKNRDLMAVNFAANSDEFRRLMPRYYVLADPHFFTGESTDQNVKRLWENLLSADWPMTLFVPVKDRAAVERRIAKRGNIEVKGFNMTPVEGWKWLCHRAYTAGLGMPRPRNVLIPALMLALREGYRKIFIAGADHSWSKTLWVDDKNRVVSIQPHFYPDGEEERDRVAEAYKGLHLHDIYQSFAIAFRSYFAIRDYAATLDADIINITPGSFIDAFPRQ